MTTHQMAPNAEGPQATNPQDATLQRQQFIASMRWVQRGALLTIITEIALGAVLGVAQMYFLALLTLLILVTSTLARRLAHDGNLKTSVYLLAASIFAAVGAFPLFVVGTLPLVLVGYAGVVILIGLFISTRDMLRATIVATAMSLLPLTIDYWAPVPRLEVPFFSIAITLITMLFFSGLIYLLAETLGQALDASRQYAQALEQSQAELLVRTEELEITANDLAARSRELEETNLKLQQTMKQSRRRAELLQASVRVSQAAAQFRDTDQLLPRVTQLISHHFGYYHVGIFIIDRPSGYAVLRAANSDGGKQLLARKHKQRVGAEGIVGHVTATGQSRVALDVGQDAVYMEAPELPDTRSEMAVPLRVGDEIIGALDVQSTQEAAFGDEEVAILSGLAEQIAIAIQNARIFQQSQQALQEAEETYRRYLRQEWDTFVGRPRIKRTFTARAPVSLTGGTDDA